ncbi:hypothetical protein MASR2M78_00640 [Treponema sp.]
MFAIHYIQFILSLKEGLVLSRDDIFKRFQNQGFIKTGEKPVIDSARKVALNRRGNELFNAGKIEDARRIFMTTSYTDGLTRVGDHYARAGRDVDALKMYWIAPDKVKAQKIIARLAGLIQNVMAEEEEA